jgi:hypothetical protein
MNHIVCTAQARFQTGGRGGTKNVKTMRTNFFFFSHKEMFIFYVKKLVVIGIFFNQNQKVYWRIKTIKIIFFFFVYYNLKCFNTLGVITSILTVLNFISNIFII